MKISSSIRKTYDAQYEINKLLEGRVRSIFETKKRSTWFFTSRIKGLESFAQKLETGRIADPKKMEDFFACTLVVENRTAISQAITLVEEQFEIVRRRPKSAGQTHKSPDSFPFDDLRLYAKLKPNDALPETALDDLEFEIQIKTFLQHAWGIATHDLVYKGESIHWGKARVAYQIKAMLEHAEVSVEQVNVMAESPVLAVSDAETRDKQKLINWLKETWQEEMLPKDLVRLADTILKFVHSLRVGIDDLIHAVKHDSEKGAGSLLHNLSPYAVVVRSLYNNQQDKFNSFLQTPSKGFRLFVADDPEMAAILKNANPEKVIYLGD